MLYVTIRRNFQPPVFDALNLFREITIPEDTHPGIVFMTLTASDADRQPPNNVVNFRYRAADNGADADYFQINAGGGISVKTDLRTDPNAPAKTSYIVCYLFCFLHFYDYIFSWSTR